MNSVAAQASRSSSGGDAVVGDHRRHPLAAGVDVHAEAARARRTGPCVRSRHRAAGGRGRAGARTRRARAARRRHGGSARGRRAVPRRGGPARGRRAECTVVSRRRTSLVCTAPWSSTERNREYTAPTFCEKPERTTDPRPRWLRMTPSLRRARRASRMVWRLTSYSAHRASSPGTPSANTPDAQRRRRSALTWTHSGMGEARSGRRAGGVMTGGLTGANVRTFGQLSKYPGRRA